MNKSGIASATELIKECISKKSTRLDIGQCGLTRIPAEVWKMDWLEELIIGNNPTVPGDYEFLRFEQEFYSKVFLAEGKMTLNEGEPNQLNPKEELLFSRLPKLKYLNVCRLGSPSLIDLAPLRNLTILIAGENHTLNFRSNLDFKERNIIEVLDFGRCEGLEWGWIFAAGNTRNLRYLSLCHARAESFIFLTDVPSLVSLNLGYSKQTGTSPASRMTTTFLRPNLKFLQMNGTFLKDDDITPLGKLTNLECLIISNNEIESLKALAPLKRLKVLRISRNQVSDLSPLSNMQSLEELLCAGNKITSIEPLKGLKSIKEFNADNNEISNLQPLSEWGQVEHISICNNRIENIIPLLNLNSLTELLLTDNDINSIEQVKQLASMDKLVILKLFANPVKDLPRTLLGADASVNCLAALRGYFTSLKESDTQKNTEIKLILVGNSTAGKTTLRKLLQKKKFDSKEDSTHGIVMETWKLDDKTLEEFSSHDELYINILDFGGQEYYHETHKLFFSENAVYILVWADETNKRVIKDTPLFEKKPDGTVERVTKYIEHQHYEYWLKNIRHYSNSCPIIMVQNQIDKYIEPAVNADTPPTTEKNKKIRVKRVEDKLLDAYGVDQSFDVSLKMFSEGKADYKFEYEKFLRYLTRTLAETIGHFDIPESHLNIKREMLKLREKVNLIDFTEYQNKCLAIDPGLAGQMESVSKFLTDTSTILYYPKHPALRNKVFINPIWVSETIYKILDQDVLERSGEFTEQHVKNKIGNEFAPTFIELMKEFQLIFKAETKDKTEQKYIAPQFLPEGAATRSYSIFKAQCNQPRLVIRFPQFLPKTFMNGVLSRFAGRSIDKSYYRYGVAFESQWITNTQEENINIIEADFDKNEVAVFSISPNPYNLREIFEALLTDYTGFRNAAELAGESQRTSTNILNIVALSKIPVHISTDGRNFFSWNELYERSNNMMADPQPLYDDTIILPIEGSPAIAMLFKPYYLIKPEVQSMSSISKVQEPPRIFISYSHKDEMYKDELLEHLSGMRRNGEIKEWTDRAIVPGERWDDVIKKNLEDANIVLFLISSSFVASDYIQNVEIKRVIERNNRGEVVIIPIPIRPFDYKSLYLKDIQSASKDFKPISTAFASRDLGWSEVVTNLRTAIESWKSKTYATPK